MTKQAAWAALKRAEEAAMISHVALVIAFCSLVVAGYGSATAQSNINGYGKTTWGMTPDQVLTAEAPDAKKSEQPGQLGDLIGAIAITDIKLGPDKFDATFYFDSDHRLQTVVLKCLETNNVQANARTFSILEKLFTEKYGSPTYRDGVERPRVFWELSDTTIRLVHFTAFAGRISRLNVSYMPSRLSTR